MRPKANKEDFWIAESAERILLGVKTMVLCLFFEGVLRNFFVGY
jgi:hypothetical protein